MAETFLLFSAHKTQTESLTHPRQRGIQWHNACFSPPLPQSTWETPSGRMHWGNASQGTFPHKAGKTIQGFLTKHVRSKMWITTGFYITHSESDPFHAHIFYLDCYLRTHLVSLWIYFCWTVKVFLGSSWIEFTVVTALVCPEAGGSPVWTVGIVWWNLGLCSAVVCTC